MKNKILECISSITEVLNKLLPLIISIFIIVGFLFIGLSVSNLFERNQQSCTKSSVVINKHTELQVITTESSNNSYNFSGKTFLLISLGVGSLVIARYLETIRKIE